MSDLSRLRTFLLAFCSTHGGAWACCDRLPVRRGSASGCHSRRGGASGSQSRQHSPHLRRVPLTATGRRNDAASVERHSKAIQAGYAGRRLSPQAGPSAVGSIPSQWQPTTSSGCPNCSGRQHDQRKVAQNGIGTGSARGRHGLKVPAIASHDPANTNFSSLLSPNIASPFDRECRAVSRRHRECVLLRHRRRLFE
jgi:hypothetical protein